MEHRWYQRMGQGGVRWPRRRPFWRISPPPPLFLAVAAAMAAGVLPGAPSAALTTEDAPAAKSDLFLQKRLAVRPQTGWAQVIVRIEGAGAGGGLTEAREREVRALGGYVYRRLNFIQSAAMRVPNKNLPRLAALPWVKRLSTDTTVLKNDGEGGGSGGSAAGSGSNGDRSGADVALGQYGLTGAGVAVAVVDTGIHAGHADFQGNPGNGGGARVIASADFLDPANQGADLCGHGTHVAGIIAGDGAASTGRLFTRTFAGVARRANLVNVRVLNERGRGDVSTVIRGIEWVVANREALNIRVLNLSAGHVVGESYTTDPLCQAVEAAWKAGIVVVCAAGNNGREDNDARRGRDNEGYGTAYGSIQSPANSPYAITVGAMKTHNRRLRQQDRIATYSGRGPTRLDHVLKPDLVAPGDRIISTLADGSYLDERYSGSNQVRMREYSRKSKGATSTLYFRLSGTSMSAPVVSGAAALLLERDPTLTPDTVKARLMAGADKWARPNGTWDAFTYGAGYVNIPSALQSTIVATRSAVSPSVFRDDAGGVHIDINTIIWGEDIIWGSEQIDSSTIIWGENILAGTPDILRGSTILWGEQVWTDQDIRAVATSHVDLSSVVLLGDDDNE